MPAGAVPIWAEVPWERQSGRRSQVGGPGGGERKSLGKRVTVTKPGNPLRACPPPREQPSGLGPSCAPGGRRVAAEDLVVAAVKGGGHGLLKSARPMALGREGCCSRGRRRRLSRFEGCGICARGSPLRRKGRTGPTVGGS